MKRTWAKRFILSSIFWLMPGMAAGFLSAILFGINKYEFTVRLAESVLEGESLPAALKHAGNKAEAGKIRNISENGTALTKNAGQPQSAPEYLEAYGYRRFGNLTEHLPYAMKVCIPLFETVGIVWFFIRRTEEKRRGGRVGELTEYLKAAGRGEAKALTRQEDEFSYLEDEIYKTVFELACTKEEAVKDHEILSERIADIAHQLKTPLTSMSLMTELLEPAQREDEEYLDRLKEQVERLKALVEGLLTLAKLDSHTLEFSREAVELEELIEISAKPIQGLLKQRKVGLEVRCASQEEIWIQADMQWTAEAFLNILKNCMEHTPENEVIHISYEKNPLYVLVVIEDGGTGFAKQDLPHLFERFYRGENAAKDSAGIGLALAKSVIEAQNGQVYAENSAAGHARFKIKFYM